MSFRCHSNVILMSFECQKNLGFFFCSIFPQREGQKCIEVKRHSKTILKPFWKKNDTALGLAPGPELHPSEHPRAPRRRSKQAPPPPHHLSVSAADAFNPKLRPTSDRHLDRHLNDIKNLGYFFPLIFPHGNAENALRSNRLFFSERRLVIYCFTCA